eukprot:6305517-Lingulodinium_polyedra.AAC.1
MRAHNWLLDRGCATKATTMQIVGATTVLLQPTLRARVWVRTACSSLVVGGLMFCGYAGKLPLPLQDLRPVTILARCVCS